MKGRTARRLALMRHERWLVRHHPDSIAPPCLIRAYNRRVREDNRKQYRKARDRALAGTWEPGLYWLREEL